MSVTLHVDGSKLLSPCLTPVPRLCEEIKLLPLYGASFWFSIWTPVSQDTSPKGSCWNLMCPLGISVQEGDVKGWLATCSWSQEPQVSQVTLRAGLCVFILDIPHGLAAPRQMLHVLTCTCRSLCWRPGMFRLLRDLVKEPQLSATPMALASFSGGSALLPLQSSKGNTARSVSLL